ncbi:hypothetical protein BDK51DRAFT_32711, partial [Blyttiomyces helicus]
MTNTTIAGRLAKFTPVHLTADTSRCTAGDLEAVKKLVQVAKIFDSLYMQQAWAGNGEQYEKVKASGDADTIRLYHLMRGPWDRVAENEPFLEGVPERPETGSFYPSDMTKSEFEAFRASLSPEEQAAASGFYTVVRRDEVTGALKLVKFSDEYRAFLESAASLLREAAALVSDASLRAFLNARADAFVTNEYVESDILWLKVSADSPLEVTCGPYEVYTDALLSQKSAYEIYIHVRDFPFSEKLKKFGSLLQAFEDSLPVEPKYINASLGNNPTPIVAIVEGGSKLVIIKNVQEGKFKHVLMPIARIVIDPEQLPLVDFDAFFTHILLHEVAHS